MDLKAIEERANKATPGPWFWEVQSLEGQPRWKTKFCGPPGLLTDESYENEGYVIDTRCDDCLGERDACTPEDADFIAHAREDIPALLARVKELGNVLGQIWVATDCECDKMIPVTCGHHLAEQALKDLERWPIVWPATVSDTPSDKA